MDEYDGNEVIRLFTIIQNIPKKGRYSSAMCEQVSVTQIYDSMPPPKLEKDVIRSFCETQFTLGSLDKFTGKDKIVRQAEAEYAVNQKGRDLISLWLEPENTMRKMMEWSSTKFRK